MLDIPDELILSHRGENPLGYSATFTVVDSGQSDPGRLVTAPSSFVPAPELASEHLDLQGVQMSEVATFLPPGSDEFGCIVRVVSGFFENGLPVLDDSGSAIWVVDVHVGCDDV